VSRYIIEPQGYRISFLFRKILVPVDGSESSLRALDMAIDFSQRYGSSITAFYAVPEGASPDRVKEAVMNRARSKGVDIKFEARTYDPLRSSAASTILEEIERGSYDLVILGARGHTPSEELMLGSTALAIVVNSAVSVVIVR
jgi:nucleotide-binding universal stress UspA family protein